MYLELKEYGLRFVREHGHELGIGKLVSLNGEMPTYKTEIGYIIEMREEDGLMLYGIMELGDTTIYWYDTKSLILIKPILVSGDDICVGDLFYTNDGGVYECSRITTNRTYDTSGNEYRRRDSYRVISLTDGIGYSISEGLLKEDGVIWRSSSNETIYLEEYSPMVLKRIVLNDMRVMVVVNEVCKKHGESNCECLGGFMIKPVIFNDRVIMDTYKLLKRSGGYYFY